MTQLCLTNYNNNIKPCSANTTGMTQILLIKQKVLVDH